MDRSKQPIQFPDEEEIPSTEEPWISTNKILIRQIGLLPAVYYSYLLSKRFYFKQQRELIDDGSFHITDKKQSQDLMLGIDKISSLRKNLISLKLISTKRLGIPARLYYKIL